MWVLNNSATIFEKIRFKKKCQKIDQRVIDGGQILEDGTRCITIYSWLEVDVTDLHRPAIRDAAILRPARRIPLVGRRLPGTGSF